MRSSSFWMTTLMVVLLHWVALHHLPWSQAAAAAAVPSQRSSFQTRTITPIPVPAEPAPAGVSAAPAPAPQPVKKPLKANARPQKVEAIASTNTAPPLPRASAVQEQPQDSVVDSASTDFAPTDHAAGSGADQDAFAQDFASTEPSAPEAATVVAAATVPADAVADAAKTPEAALVPAEIEPQPSKVPAATDSPDNPRGPGIEVSLPGSANHGAVQKTLPAQWPASRRLLFDVSGQAKKFNYNASAALTWQHDGKAYQAEQKISAFLVGQRIQRSVGEIQGALLAPVRFSDKSRSEKAAHFNHTEHVVTFSSNAPTAPLDVGAQDRLSVFIQLAAWFKAAPDQFTKGSTITLTTVSTSKADRWAFRVEGNETLELPAGAMPTIKLQRLPREQYDQKAELWLAPAIDYLPARIRLTQTNGDFADLKLSGYETP